MELAGLYYFCFWASSAWYFFHPGHHVVCHRQIRERKARGFFSALSLMPQVSHFEAILTPPDVLRRNVVIVAKSQPEGHTV
jgi:hypothetical protein